MRYKLILAFLSMVAALVVSPQVLNVLAQEGQREGYDLPERDEFHQTYQLSPGASVQVLGISGPVEIETANTNTAEVHVVRSARNRADLDHRKIVVEYTPSSLVVRSERDQDCSSCCVEVRQRVMLKIPRQVDLTTKGISGHVRVGEIDGPVHISGISGHVEVAQAAGYSEVSGISGSVVMTIVRLGERGIRVTGISGRVELRFADDLNADLDVRGISGSVDTEKLNAPITLQGKLNRSSFHARIGSGGAPISISGVSGSVHLSRTGSGLSS